MSADMLVTTSPFTMMSTPHFLTYNDSTRDLAIGAAWIFGSAHIELSMTLKRAAAHRRTNTVHLKTYDITIIDPRFFSLSLPVGHSNFSI